MALVLVSVNYHLFSNRCTVTGSGSWGFKDIFQEYDKIIAVEPSTAMRKLGKHMTQDVEKILWLESLAQTINISSVDLVDFVYCGYVLEEASNAESNFLFFGVRLM